MKKYMSWIGMVAILLVALSGLNTLLRNTGSQKQMQGVEQYMAQRYPGESFTYSAAQKGGRGTYSIVHPASAPDDSFRVFAANGSNAFEDTYYTITLRDEACIQAQQLVRKVFPSACVLCKVYQLAEGETLPAYPALDTYLTKKGANIDLRIIVDVSETAIFTQANIERTLEALSASFVSENVVFSLAQEGKFFEASKLSYTKAASQARQWSAQNVQARISGKGSWQLR